MTNQTIAITPEQILEIALRRRWLIIIPLCLTLIGGIVHAVRTPSIFMSRTLILVQPQKVPSNYVQSLVSTDINSRVSIIKQMILSRTNLEKIIEKFGLFAESKGMFMEDKVAAVARRIGVSGTKGRGRGDTDSFSISFEGVDPRRVMNIANDLAAFVIEENLKVREAQALGTSVFLDSELDQMRERLERHESSLKEYRERYMGGLPQQLDSNLKILDRLQAQYSDREAGLREARNRMAILESQMLQEAQLAQELRNQSMISVAGEKVIVEDGVSEEQKKLARMKEELQLLLGKYTERHPDVIRMVKMIKGLEADILAMPKADSPAAAPLAPVKKTGARLKYDQVQYQQLLALKSEIDVHRAEIEKIRKQTLHYQSLVEETPKREQELLSLNRNYQNIKKSYDSLLERKLEAQIAVNMEKKQKGEQFRILDYARMAQKPVSPDLRKVFMLAAAAGLGIGAGIIFVLEFLNPCLRRPDEIESLLGVPVMASIPFISSPVDIRKKRIGLLVTMGGLLCVMGLAGICFVMIVKGVGPTVSFAGKLIGR